MHARGEGCRSLANARGQLQLHTAQNLHTKDGESHQHVRQNHASGRYSLCGVGTTVGGTTSATKHVSQHGHHDNRRQNYQPAEEERARQRLQSRGNNPTPHTCGRDAGVRGRRVAGENVQERVPGSTQRLHCRMRCARRIGCLAGLTRLSGTRLRGGCLSLSTRLCISVYLSGLRRLLRLDGLLRCYRRGRLSSITLLARLHGLTRLHGLARLGSLSCVTRLSSLTRKRSILRGVCAGVVAVAVAAGCTLRRVVGSVLRH